jgi:hypothetical protein
MRHEKDRANIPVFFLGNKGFSMVSGTWAKGSVMEVSKSRRHGKTALLHSNLICKGSRARDDKSSQKVGINLIILIVLLISSSISRCHPFFLFSPLDRTTLREVVLYRFFISHIIRHRISQKVIAIIGARPNIVHTWRYFFIHRIELGPFYFQETAVSLSLFRENHAHDLSPITYSADLPPFEKIRDIRI